MIKLFFYLHFFCLAHYNVQNRLGGAIKPASAVPLGSAAFLALRGTSPSLRAAGKVHGASTFHPSHSASVPCIYSRGHPGGWEPGSPSRGARSCSGAGLVFHSSRCWGGGARIEAPALAFKPKWLPGWGPGIRPSLLLPFNSRPRRTRQGRTEEAGGAPEPSLQG